MDHKVFSSFKRLSSFYRWTAPLMYFTAILVSLPFVKPVFSFQRKRPLRSETTLQHLLKTETRFFTEKETANSLSRPAHRVWLPSQRFIKTLFFRKHISALNALGLCFPKLFSLQMIVRRFPFSLSVLALFCKTLFRPNIGASTAWSHHEEPSSYFASLSS